MNGLAVLARRAVVLALAVCVGFMVVVATGVFAAWLAGMIA